MEESNSNKLGNDGSSYDTLFNFNWVSLIKFSQVDDRTSLFVYAIESTVTYKTMPNVFFFTIHNRDRNVLIINDKLYIHFV